MQKFLALLLLFISFSYVFGVERADFNMIATKKPFDSSKKDDIVPVPKRFSEANSVKIDGWNFDTTTMVWWKLIPKK